MQFLRLGWGGALASVAVLAPAHLVRAAPLTFSFEGHITRVHEYLELDDSVHIGAPFAGSYTFDPTGVTDVFPNNPNVGVYRFPSPAHISARIGNYDFVTNDLGMLIWNDQLSGDLYQPISNGGFVAAGYQWNSMLVYLNDGTGMALNTDALLLDVPDLSAFPTYRNLAIFLPGDDLGIGGTITSLTPEPGSLVLLALGAIAVCRGKKSR